MIRLPADGILYHGSYTEVSESLAGSVLFQDSGINFVLVISEE